MTTQAKHTPVEQVKTTYRIEWAYPTSDHAKQFGHYKTGCWVVEKCVGINPPVGMCGFADRKDARFALARIYGKTYEPA